ncbi:hypothetical protein [Pelobacter propionicus]|uniref:hypothetical protein n=1 Tax=Pelobacter propionicus TaxID=29543 RepID=UPI0018DDDFC8|nr:hypothetical protein [Pelobacter propionicus]
MKRLSLMVIALGLLSGCSHSQWVAAKTNTQVAGFVNPLGFAINMVASAGEIVSRPSTPSAIQEDNPQE